jgi:anaerobic magnesium-protoporphyrin IX monomethyl ester cyclase
VKDTIRLLRDIRPLVTIFHVLSVFPGTFLYDLFKSQTGATDDIWLHYQEDLILFEIDKRLCAETVSQLGRSLKQELMGCIPDFFHSFELVDARELFPFHAGFFSRLALTLDRGDYPHVLPEGAAQELGRELYYLNPAILISYPRIERHSAHEDTYFA